MKLPDSQISQEEINKLLELIENPVKRKYKTRDKNIERFIQELGIKSGKKKVPCTIIYYTYRVWPAAHHRNRRQFFNIFKRLFERTRTETEFAYFLDPEAFDLTTEGYFKARAFWRRQKYEVEKKKRLKSNKG